MAVEQFRGYVAALVAAVSVVGGAIGAAWAWHQSSIGGMTSDLALILAVFTGLIGSGTTFLFVAEGASRATHAAERSFEAGSYAGSTMPQQATKVAPPIVGGGTDGSGAFTDPMDAPLASSPTVPDDAT